MTNNKIDASLSNCDIPHTQGLKDCNDGLSDLPQDTVEKASKGCNEEAAAACKRKQAEADPHESQKKSKKAQVLQNYAVSAVQLVFTQPGMLSSKDAGPVDVKGKLALMKRSDQRHAAAGTAPRMVMVRDVAAKISKIEVTARLNPNQNGHVLLFQGKIPDVGHVFLKMKRPSVDLATEADNMLTMLSSDSSSPTGSSQPQGAVSTLVPSVYGFINFMHRGEVWGGICMEYIQYSAFEIISPVFSQKLSSAMTRPGPPEPQSETKRALAENMAKLQQAFETHHRHSLSLSQSHANGIPVRYVKGCSLQTSVLCACLELLNCMHRAGWVHGDTHLGNFMVDPLGWRVYVIDFERTFESICPKLQLLDLQELFGHATGLIVAPYKPHQWDMLDIMGVASQMHPSYVSGQNKQQQKVTPNSNNNNDDDDDVLRLLPLCNCFACGHLSERIDGCAMCQSALMKSIVCDHVHRKNWLESHLKSLRRLTLETIMDRVMIQRLATRQRLDAVSEELIKVWPEINKGIKEGCLKVDEVLHGLDFSIACHMETFKTRVSEMLFFSHIAGSVTEDRYNLALFIRTKLQMPHLAALVLGHTLATSQAV